MIATREPRPVAYVTWQRHAGRAEEICDWIDGTVIHVYMASLTRRPLVPLRYLLSSLETFIRLLRASPRTVIVTNPPLIPGLVVALYCQLTGKSFILDSHTSSFGVKGNRLAARLIRVHQWLARRSLAVLVATAGWGEVVRAWGAKAMVVHEAPPKWIDRVGEREKNRVLFVSVYADDEPVTEVVEAARLLPEITIAITGDLRRRPAGLAEKAGDNIEFLGFLDASDYADEVLRSSVVLSLTTEPTSIMRAACEASYGRRQLVVSDSPELRQAFPYAIPTLNEPASIAKAILKALERAEDSTLTERASATQLAHWEEQLSGLQDLTARYSPGDVPRGGGSPGRCPRG